MHTLWLSLPGRLLDELEPADEPPEARPSAELAGAVVDGVVGDHRVARVMVQLQQRVVQADEQDDEENGDDDVDGICQAIVV